MCIQPTTFSFELFSAHFFTDGSHVASYYCVATPAIQCPYRPYAATFIQPRRRRWIHRIRFSFSLSFCVCTCLRTIDPETRLHGDFAPCPSVIRNQRSPLSPITEEHRNTQNPIRYFCFAHHHIRLTLKRYANLVLPISSFIVHSVLFYLLNLI